MTGIRRLELESTGSMGKVYGPDYSVAVMWIDDQTLHAALMDYGDSDYMGRGIDVVEPTRLLEWLIDDRFLGKWERFVSYCDSSGVGVLEDPEGPASDRDRFGIPLTWADGALCAYRGPWGDPPTCYRIGDWRGLTLVLLRDRCEGRDSWDRLRVLLDDAKIETVERWRGYV